MRMNNERIEAPCRLDNGTRWCTECCEGRNCPSFGELPDDSWGCLSWGFNKASTVPTFDGELMLNPPPKYCLEASCLLDTPLSVQDLSTLIRKQPPGEFRMSEII